MRHPAAHLRSRWSGPMAASAAIHLVLAGALPAPHAAGPSLDETPPIVLELLPETRAPRDRMPDDDALGEDAEGPSGDLADGGGEGEGQGEGEGAESAAPTAEEAELQPADRRPRSDPDPALASADDPDDAVADAQAAAEAVPAAALPDLVQEPEPAAPAETLAAQAERPTDDAGSDTRVADVAQDGGATAEAEADLHPDQGDDVPAPEAADAEDADDATAEAADIEDAAQQDGSDPAPPEDETAAPAAPEAEAAQAEAPDTTASQAEDQPDLPEEGAGDSMKEDAAEKDQPKPKKKEPEEEVEQAAKREERREKRERQEEEEEAEQPDETEFLPFVWTDAPFGDRPPLSAESIAAHDVRTEERARPEVTDIDAGPRLDGVASKVLGVPTPVQATPDEFARRAAGDPENTRDPTEAERTTAAAQAAAATTTATEATVQAAEAQAPATPSTSTVAADTTPLGGAPAADLPPRDSGSSTPVETTDVPEVLVPEWWLPSSLRVTGAAPTPAQTPSVMGRPDPTQAQVPTSGEPARRSATGGGAAQQDPGAQVAVGAAAGEQVERVREAQEHVDDPAVASGHLNPNRPTEPFAPSRSPLAAFDEAKDVERPLVEAIATPLGVWIRDIDLMIRERWANGDLAVMDRAFGLGGDVVVQFMVSRSGRVDAIEVVEGSGVAALDAMARMAVPERLPRPPEGPVAHRVTFKYRSR